MEKALILTRAKSATIAHDFVTAARLYKELLRDDESNVEYLKQLGSIYVQAGEDEKAIPYYSQIITFYPHYIDAMNSLGAIYRRLHRYEESIEILQRALDEDRQLPAVNYNLGYTYREMKNYEDAIDAFEKVIRVNPDDVLAYNHLGSVYFAQKEYEKSIASYKRGLQIDRNHPILNYNLARVYETIKNNNDAVRCYQTALKTRPGWTDAIKDYTGLLMKTHNSKEASDVIQQGIKLYPNNTEMLGILGDIYLNDYDYPSAEATFKKACSIKPTDVNALVGLSKALEKSDKSEYALDAALAALELEPDNRDAKKQYAQTLLSEKEYDNAKEAVDSLYEPEEGKKDLQVLDLRGQYFICNQEEEKAKECFESIKRLDHHYKDYMVNAANRYAQIGKYEQAEIYANEYLVHRPDNIDGYNTLGKINYLREDYDKASEYYKKASTLGKNNVLAEKQLKTISDKVERDALFAQKVEEITGENPNKVEEFTSTDPKVIAEAEDNTEEFDYDLIGGGPTPLQEGLTQDEEDFWKAEDKDSEPEIPEEKEENPEDLISPARKEDEQLKQALSDAAGPEDAPYDLYADEKKPTQPIENDEDDNFDFSAFTPDARKEKDEDASGASGLDDAEASIEPETGSLAKEETPADDIEEIKRANKELTDKALEAASKMEEQQQKLQEQTEEALKNALEKIHDLEEQKYRDQDQAFEQMLNDAEEQPKSYEPSKPKMDEFLASDEPLPAEEEEEEFDIFDGLTVEEEEPEPVVQCSVITEPFDETDGEPEAAEETEETADTPEVAETSEGDGEPEVAESADAADQAQSEPSATDMLERIERILNDDDAALNNAEKIEMFKKLRVLCDFLPEAEKNTFQSCRNRMVIDYIIAKLSGKPGLFLTTLSLLKSGVLGDEYLSRSLEEDFENQSITNEMLRQVILNMKKMAQSLDDKYLTQALCATADSILERIEIENQKAQIF